MSLKSIFRAVWPFRSNSGPSDLADLVRGVAPPSTPFLDRLKGRSDWPTRWGMRPADPHAPGGPLDSAPLPIDPAPAVAPWDKGSTIPVPNGPEWIGQAIEQYNRDVQASHLRTCDPWPASDDPYAKPEPCDIVPDPALPNLKKLAERGLTRPLDSAKSVTDLLTLIQRQEDAEAHLRSIGMVWTRERGWHLPDPFLA